MVDKPPKYAPNNLFESRTDRLLDTLIKKEDISKTDVKSLFHELQIHQVELEVQNEELQQTQLILSETRDQYRELYDHAPVAYLTLDLHGIILDANFKAAEFLGSTRRNLLGGNLAKYIASDSQDAFYFHQRAVFTTNEKQTVEVTIRRETRTVVRIESIAKALTATESVQSHTVLIDISMEKATEEALKKLNWELEKRVSEKNQEINIRKDERAAILNTVPDAIITINDMGVIETVNHATDSMFGYTETELVGSQISQLMPEPHASAHNRYINRYLETGQSRILGRSTEMLGRRKDSTLFPVSVSVNRIDDELRFIGIIRDMTERVKLEEEVLNSIEIERNRISRELHDNVSQSLVGIAMKARSLADTMELTGNQNCAVQLAELSLNLESAGREVNAIVKDLAALQLQEICLEDYFKGLVASCNAYSKAEITLDWQDGLLIGGQRTGTQLFRIAQEALNNAIKHAKATEILVKVAENAGTITLTVTDNGIGKATENMKQSHLVGMTGLGINNMKYRAHVIGSTLAITSDENGTTVSCILPG